MTEAASSRAQASPVARRHRRQGRLRLPIAAVLVGGFGLLMLAAVASVLALGLGSAGRNTFALLGDKASLALHGVSVRVRHQLDPARNQALHIADLIARGAIDPADRPRMLDTLRAALAGTP